MKAQIQCEFAKDSVQMFRCPKKATRKWGDHWFCEEHGSRAPLPLDKTQEELDTIEFWAWRHAHGTLTESIDIWKAALAYARNPAK